MQRRKFWHFLGAAIVAFAVTLTFSGTPDVVATSATPTQGPTAWARWAGTIDSLQSAIEDLIATFGPKYPNGRAYLKRLEVLKKSGAEPGHRFVQSLATEALLANPLLNSLRLVLVKRPNFGGHDGFFGYTS